jgi:hypothetical protein
LPPPQNPKGSFSSISFFLFLNFILGADSLSLVLNSRTTVPQLAKTLQSNGVQQIFTGTTPL